MTAYYIQTPAGKEGPFSVEELRKKAITADTFIRHEGINWTAAGKIEALRMILPETGPPHHFKKHEGSKYNFSADGIKEPKTRSRVSVLQWAAIVLLVLNGLVYYYKEVRSPAAKTVEVAALPASPVKRIIAVQNTVKPAEKQEIAKADTNSTVRNNWSSFIKATHNKFKYYTKRGGIRHLQAIVQNQTNFPLDTVQVAVKYIRQGETFKTEYVTFYNVPEHGEVAIPAPNSRSGTSVVLDIMKISSEKLQFFYSSDVPVSGGEDPYFKM